ncbi:MAG: hypothetical protein CME59_17450 [Halioglobus sp.]|nr:hypothetical protein [Halioglobus sp.]
MTAGETQPLTRSGSAAVGESYTLFETLVQPLFMVGTVLAYYLLGDPLLVLALGFVVLTLLEWRRPYRRDWIQTRKEWLENAFFLIGTIFIFDPFYTWAYSPLYEYSIALKERWELSLNGSLSRPVQILSVYIVIELLFYLLHLAQHKLLILWRTHKLHHYSRKMMWAKYITAHPVELALFPLAGLVTSLLFSIEPDDEALYIFTFPLLVAVFTHSNIRTNPALLGWLFVTPQYHFKHHSSAFDTRRNRAVGDCNYGVSLILFDRLFGTFDPGTVIDPVGVQPRNELNLWQQLLTPFQHGWSTAPAREAEDQS